MSSILSVIGKNLDIDLLVSGLSIIPKIKKYKGTSRNRNRPHINLLPHSRLTFIASDAEKK
jgi:hypothetical protein